MKDLEYTLRGDQDGAVYTIDLSRAVPRITKRCAKHARDRNHPGRWLLTCGCWPPAGGRRLPAGPLWFTDWCARRVVRRDQLRAWREYRTQARREDYTKLRHE